LFDLTDGSVSSIRCENASSNNSMIRELKSTVVASTIELPALRNHLRRVAHIIQPALGAFIGIIGVKGRTKSSETHECDQRFGENESTDIGKSQRLRKEGIATINKLLAMRPGSAKIVEKVHLSRHFESSETHLHIAANA